MKPELVDKIAIFRPTMQLDGDYGKKMGTQLTSAAPVLKNLKLQAVLFSLQNVPKYDNSGINYIATALENLQDVLEIETGFLDYDDKFFKNFLSSNSSSSIGLYKNFEMARILIDSKKHQNYNNIVIFEENTMLLELLVGELKGRGYKVEVANSRKDFDKMFSQRKSDTVFICDIHMDLVGNFIPTVIQNGAVVYELQKKLDSKMEQSFNFTAFNSKLADGFKLFVFDAKSVTQVGSSIYDFFISLALQSVKYNGKIVITGLNKRFLPKMLEDKLKKSGIIIFESLASIWSDPDLKKLQKANGVSKGLTKKHVAALPVLVEASLETFESLTGLKATKKGHKISTCILDLKGRIVAASLGFRGEVTGNLVLIFNEPIAKKMAEMMLGDENCSFEELLDATSEFANIIGGRCKALLAERGEQINIAIPKTFDSLTKLTTFLEDKNGIQIELEIDSDPMVIFLTY